jgi:hypothetical protein
MTSDSINLSSHKKEFSEDYKSEKNGKQMQSDILMATDTILFNRQSMDDIANVTKIGERYDIYGNIIGKGMTKKTFKVSFRDKIPPYRLAEVIDIQSYKNYEVEPIGDKVKLKNTQCSCGCIVI